MRKATIFLTCATALMLALSGCDRGETIAEKAEQAAEKAKDAASSAADSAAAAAESAKDAAAQGFEAIKTQVEELYNKAVKLVEEKNFTEAKSVTDQLAKWKDQVPAEWQSKISDLVKKVEDGIKSLGGGN